MTNRIFTVLVLAASLLVVACASAAATATAPSPPASTPTAATAPATAAPTATVGNTAATPSTAAAARASTASPSTAGAVRFGIAPEGTEARFRVREQLADRSLPSDAVGATKAVSGNVVLGADGKIVADQSKFVVDLKSLQSDSSKRDNFIKRSTLNTAEYPSAEFVPTEIRGLPSPLPESGKVSFQLVGNMTVHGVTHPLTWDVTGQVDGKNVTGQATTSFKFEDFGMDPPRVAVVLSVQDNVKLELDFHLVRSA